MNDDELRDKLTKALAGDTDYSPHTAEMCIDALMPVVREALKSAWDDGHASGWVGVEIIRNPWRQEQP